MCELFGFSAAAPAAFKKQLREFYSHSGQHPHGWGIMYDGGIVKGAGRADESEVLRGLIDCMQPQAVLLGHIRYATVGSIRLENCHPFKAKDITGRDWVMIHNGTIYSGSRLIPFLQHQRGDTDSERLFLYLISSLNEAQQGGALDAAGRFGLIERIVKEIAPRNKLNLMIWDGEVLYVHKNMEDTMKYRRYRKGYIFSTTALDDEEWEDVPTAQLRGYRDGELIFEGEEHGGIFVPTLQYIRAMDAMNI